MALRSKIRVGILRGGASPGHERSVKTGARVLKSLPDNYAAVDIFVDKTGVWHAQGVAQTPAKILKKVDAVFNATHGGRREDKTPLNFLDAFAVPYTGSGRVASALAGHKGYVKSLLKSLGIKTPHHKIIKKDGALAKNLRELWRNIPNPSVIKAAGPIFSDGGSVVKIFSELEPALEKAFSRSDAALVEEYIVGREAACGAIDFFRGEKIYALIPVEFAASATGGIEAVNPGRFSALEKYHMQETAKKAHEFFGLRHYSFSSFVVSSKRGVYFTGVDGLPYLGAGSPYAGAFDAAGLSFGGFLDHVIALALEGK